MSHELATGFNVFCIYELFYLHNSRLQVYIGLIIDVRQAGCHINHTLGCIHGAGSMSDSVSYCRQFSAIAEL